VVIGDQAATLRVATSANELALAAVGAVPQVFLLNRFGPSPMSGPGTSLALIGAYLLAHHIAGSDDPPMALALWETDFRANVEQNQRLATDGMATLLPASRLGTFARNQSLRVLPLLSRMGGGFGGRIERASRAVTLPGC
jgi:hypothetical protein